jgi:hypothetical protein
LFSYSLISAFSLMREKEFPLFSADEKHSFVKER